MGDRTRTGEWHLGDLCRYAAGFKKSDVLSTPILGVEVAALLSACLLLSDSPVLVIIGNDENSQRCRAGIFPNAACRVHYPCPLAFLFSLSGYNEQAMATMKTQTDKITGDEIRDIREKNGWTQRDLARELGVTHAAIAHWETGNRAPSGPARKLLRILEKTS